MKSEEDQQAAICCREEVPRVQCDHCRGYEDKDDALWKRLCIPCQNKLEQYPRLISALRGIWARTDPNFYGNGILASEIRKDVEAALKFCGEKI